MLVLVWLAGLLLVPNLYAATSLIHGDDSDPLASQRADFLAAERAWRGKDLRRYRTLKKTLADYPLYPYLEFTELRQRLGKAKTGEVRGFLKRYGDTPLAGRLLNAWLRVLANRGDWKTYLAFDESSRSGWRGCNRQWALLQTGKRKQGLAGVSVLWDVGKSQPKQCDKLFKAWEQAGHLTGALVWSRFAKAMGKGDAGLARYLTRKMSKSDARLADVWIRLRSQPQRIAVKSVQRVLKMDGERQRQIIVYALKRLAWKDVEKAVSAWKAFRKGYRLSDDDQAEIFSSIGHYLTRIDAPAGLSWFKRIPQNVGDEKAKAWAVRAALRGGDWQMALDWLARMDPAQRDKDNWHYWAARAHEALGHVREANKRYAGLSLTRSYHGFMAADRIGVPYTLGDAPILVAPAVLHTVEGNAGLVRSRELHRLGRMVDARREWRDGIRSMDRTQKQAAARLADEWGWHDQAIFTAAKAKHWDDLSLRFPLVYRSTVSRHAGRQKIDMAWVYGVMRQESAFAHDARSPVGAMGLMQLMPRTARDVARKNGMRLRSKRQLLVPDVNIRLGTGYLRMMLDELDAQPVLATAAYNAGINRVRKWRPKEASMPVDLWIELIPFKETRRYVQKVFAYAVIYDQRMGKTPERLRTRLKDVYPKGWQGTPAERREAATAWSGQGY